MGATPARGFGYPRRMIRAEILKAALELSAEDRELLAEELLASLHGDSEDDAEGDAARDAERDLDEADTGPLRLEPGSPPRR
jgi:hypothetical protein